LAEGVVPVSNVLWQHQSAHQRHMDQYRRWSGADHGLVKPGIQFEIRKSFIMRGLLRFRPRIGRPTMLFASALSFPTRWWLLTYV